MAASKLFFADVEGVVEILSKGLNPVGSGKQFVQIMLKKVSSGKKSTRLMRKYNRE